MKKQIDTAGKEERRRNDSKRKEMEVRRFEKLKKNVT
jgi:hypothetical protein